MNEHNPSSRWQFRFCVTSASVFEQKKTFALTYVQERLVQNYEFLKQWFLNKNVASRILKVLNLIKCWYIKILFF